MCTRDPRPYWPKYVYEKMAAGRKAKNGTGSVI
jgi:hypothetical protein